MIQIIKKDKSIVPFNEKKIIDAASMSADRVCASLTLEEEQLLINNVKELIYRSGKEQVPVSDMHRYVEMSLDLLNPDVAKSYRSYRDNKSSYEKMIAGVIKESQSIMYSGSKENSNANSALVSTKRSLVFNVFNRELYKMFFLTANELQAIEDGYIYIHDMSGRRDTMNCCLFDLQAVLKDGFYMNSQWYNEPKSLDTFGDVVGDIIIAAAGQQYGGFTVPEIDKIMVPYAKRTYQKQYERYLANSIPADTADKMAMEDVKAQMRGCFQGWEYKFNTVSSARGDYPFINFTLGLSDDPFGIMAAKICLETRKEGQGRKGAKKPVLFPKLVFLYDENLHGEGKALEEVFESAIECSMKAMYPDYLSLTGQANGVDVPGSVPYIYKKYGAVVSPMGCRAFLSPWYKKGGLYPADEMDEPVFVGRFNIGAVSLHLPMILAKARQEDKDFFEVLLYYLEMIRKLHLRTYSYLGQMKARTNPLAFCEGGFYGGYLEEDDCIESLLDSATASFGVTALNELQRLYNGKSLVEDNTFALETMQYINDVVERFKKEDGRLYAIYGTPAENLCGKQVEQFRKKFGIISHVSDKEYVSNSFHCHVTEKIEPTQKQDLEEPFWDLFKGGRIQYCRYPVSYNKKAIKGIVRRAMKKGFYEGINLALSFCEECGYEQLNMTECPRCHSHNITKIDRMNGYLSFSRTLVCTKNARKEISKSNLDDLIASADKTVQGESRLSHHKNSEIADRISM